jgi:hypothetical protein
MVHINETVPDVLADLADLPLQHYKAINVRPSELWPITYGKQRLYSEVYGISLSGLLLALRRWSRRWNLEADWCLHMACWTLDSWREIPREHCRFVWGVGGSSWVRLNDGFFAHLTPPLGLEKWDADYQFRVRYTERAEQTIKEELAHNPMLSGLKPKMRTDFIEDRMRKVNEYCDQVLSVYDRQIDSVGRPHWKRADSKKLISDRLQCTTTKAVELTLNAVRALWILIMNYVLTIATFEINKTTRRIAGSNSIYGTSQNLFARQNNNISIKCARWRECRRQHEHCAHYDHSRKEYFQLHRRFLICELTSV